MDREESTEHDVSRLEEVLRRPRPGRAAAAAGGAVERGDGRVDHRGARRVVSADPTRGQVQLPFLRSSHLDIDQMLTCWERDQELSLLNDMNSRVAYI